MGTLNALGQILLASIPTFVLVWILYFYTARIFVGPLEKTLRKRRESTVGLRQTAEADIALAERKATEYQQALTAARTDIYRMQEQERQSALEQRAEIIREARERAEELVNRARQDLQDDVEEAKRRLAAEAEQIALAITRAILMPAAVPSQNSSFGASPVGPEVAP